MLAGFFSRPGTRTSEFAVACLTVLWYVLNAWQDWTTTNAGIKLSAPAIAYIVSRGLAKYEQRGQSTAPPAG